MILTAPELANQHDLILRIATEEEKEAKAQANKLYTPAPEGYSDVFDRSAFFRTSFQVPGKNISIQISNVLFPDESTESDWVDITSTMTGYVCTDVLFKWCRVKGVEAGDKVYVMSMRLMN